MSVLDLVRVVIYRCHEKGLEIFLTNHNLENDPEVWKIPSASFNSGETPKVIELDPINDGEGNFIRTLAIEADWHDIPSIRGMIKHDVRLVKDKILEVFPSLEEGTYFAVKDAIKKVLPHEYQALKELKEIIIDRNSVIYI